MEKQSSRAAPAILRVDPQNEDRAKKIFISYAGENRDLLKDFVKNFQYHFGEMILLFDGTAHSGNLHARFKKFAEECDIALLLVNAKFTNLESYANKHEMPILLKRQKEYRVTIVGVVFSDVDVKEWNEKGDIYFFQLRNNELTRTRRPDENADEFNNEFAVYETIKKEDRNTYHKKLAAWVEQAVVETALERAEYVKSNPEHTQPNAGEVNTQKLPLLSINQDDPRSAEQTSSILNRIDDPFLRALEQQLSMSNDYWFGFEPTEEQKNDPFLPVFFERQRKRINTARKYFEELDNEPDGLIGVRLKSMLPEMEKVQQDISGLLQQVEEKDPNLERLLTRFENKLGHLRSSLRLVHKNTIQVELRTEQIPGLFDHLERINEKMNDLDKKIHNYMNN